MIAFLADENFHGPIIEGVLRVLPTFDVIRAQDTVIYGADDPTLLEFATQSNRLLLSHDASTLIGFASDRIRSGTSTCGIIEVHRKASIQVVIEDLVMIAECLAPGEWDNLLKYLPL